MALSEKGGTHKLAMFMDSIAINHRFLGNLLWNKPIHTVHYYTHNLCALIFPSCMNILWIVNKTATLQKLHILFLFQHVQVGEISWFVQHSDVMKPPAQSQTGLSRHRNLEYWRLCKPPIEQTSLATHPALGRSANFGGEAGATPKPSTPIFKV